MSNVWAASSNLDRTPLDDIPTITEVQMDGLAILKIIKHCTEALPNMVAGSLLGLDQGKTLEVTHSFPHPSAKKETDLTESGAIARPSGELANISGRDYQIEMMKIMREVNVDNNCVGWYQSMYLGSFCTQTLVENQFTYQENLSDNAVVILYDPVQTSKGQLTIKAYRLSKEFMKSFREKKSDGLKPSEILEELPITIQNPGLINAVICDLKQGQKSKCDFERLDLSTNPFLEKNLEFLCGWVDDLSAEQWKFQNYARLIQKNGKAKVVDKRRKGGDDKKTGDEMEEEGLEKKLDPPNRLESLLISAQISTYCSQISTFTGSSFEKLFLAGSLQR
mmetsp:Transcript_14482/g.21509  ORF Transcript_14482/g.21509 Transcript_14482/m.21509 type:complete len:336 (-) Transcript_14482:27-1034(-)